eukprot:scaffold37854_cov61-Phaeocystis_antarctica.AAC.1
MMLAWLGLGLGLGSGCCCGVMHTVYDICKPHNARSLVPRATSRSSRRWSRAVGEFHTPGGDPGR